MRSTGHFATEPDPYLTPHPGVPCAGRTPISPSCEGRKERVTEAKEMPPPRGHAGVAGSTRSCGLQPYTGFPMKGFLTIESLDWNCWTQLYVKLSILISTDPFLSRNIVPSYKLSAATRDVFHLLDETCRKNSPGLLVMAPRWQRRVQPPSMSVSMPRNVSAAVMAGRSSLRSGLQGTWLSTALDNPVHVKTNMNTRVYSTRVCTSGTGNSPVITRPC